MTERYMQKRKPLRDYEDQILQIRTALVMAYPNCFVAKGQPKRPLKIGITKDLLAEVRATYPGLSVKMVKRFMTDYCRGNNYLKEMKPGAARVDLSGAFAGFVTKEAAVIARDRLRELEKRQAARDKAKKKTFRPKLTAVQKAEADLKCLLDADYAAEMSDNRYHTSGRKAEAKRAIAEARAKLEALLK